jgi:hypothetical protein
MKKLTVIVILLLGLILSGCSDDLINTGGNEPESTDLARVIIPLPVVSNGSPVVSRSVSLNEAIAKTNYFEIVFSNKTTNERFTANATLQQGRIEVQIPPGNYDILLFAGEYLPTIYVNKPPTLFASSYAQDKEILLEVPNTVNLQLATVEVDVNIPLKALIKEKFPVRVTIDFHNPLIKIVLPPQQFHLMYGGTVPYSHASSVELVKNENTYILSGSVLAPSTTGTGQVNIYHDYVMFFDEHSGTGWQYITDPPHFGGVFQGIEFVNGADVNVNITWPE